MNDSHAAFILKVLFAPVRKVPNYKMFHLMTPDESEEVYSHVYPQFLRTKKGDWYLRYRPAIGKCWVWLHRLHGMKISWKEFLDLIHLYGFKTEWAGMGKTPVDPQDIPPNLMACIEYGGWTIGSFALADPFTKPED